MKKTRNGNKIFFAFVIILILIAGSLMGILAGYLISDKNNSKDEMVSDAFCEVIKDNNLTHCYHIPKINCNAEGIDEVNNEIYNDLYSLYENNVIKSQREEGFIVMGSMTYSYETKDNALSIVIQLQDARSLEYDYFVYNVDTKNGCKMKNKDLYELFGTDEASFNAKIKNAISEYSEREKKNYPEKEVNKYINPIIEKTVSSEYISRALPYITRDGKLFAVVQLFSSAGKDTYAHMLNLDTAYTESELPVCTAHDNISSDGNNTNTPAADNSQKETDNTKEAQKVEEATTKEAKPLSDKEETNNSSDTITKELLMSHTWIFHAQVPWEFIFNADGTVEIYYLDIENYNYTIKDNALYINGTKYIYSSYEDSIFADDEYRGEYMENTLQPGEKFFWSEDYRYLIDSRGRIDENIVTNALYREFAFDKIDSNIVDEYLYFEFATADIDDDGTNEMIFHEGKSEQDREYHFYTTKNREIVYLGSVHAWHADLSESDGCLIKYAGMTGEGDYHRITIENGKIKETKEGTYTFPPVPDFGRPLDFTPDLY